MTCNGKHGNRLEHEKLRKTMLFSLFKSVYSVALCAQGLEEKIERVLGVCMMGLIKVFLEGT